jgi:hypothetical protein
MSDRVAGAGPGRPDPCPTCGTDRRSFNTTEMYRLATDDELRRLGELLDKALGTDAA